MKRDKSLLRAALNSPQTGLVFVILGLGVILTLFAGTHTDPETGRSINNFLNPFTLMQTATNASFFAIMAVGATIIIISGRIDLSVGSIYALSGVAMAMALRTLSPLGPIAAISLGFLICIVVGTLCGILNGVMVVGLRVHPFIITLGTMWILRGIAFVISKAESILVPDALTDFAKATLGLRSGLYPLPLIFMLAVTLLGVLFLAKMVAGRHVYAVGGNLEASRYSGLRIGRILIGVYMISGLTAGIAAFVGSAYYGSAACADATGYELYVIAAAVVGGASLRGGKGNAMNATLGALLIVLIRQSVTTLQLDQNYEWIIIGCAIIVAVVLDQMKTNFTGLRGKSE